MTAIEQINQLRHEVLSAEYGTKNRVKLLHRLGDLKDALEKEKGQEERGAS